MPEYYALRERNRTMSTQLSSNAPTLKTPTSIRPDSPAIPEELGNVFLAPTVGHEPCWYVRWKGCGGYIGTPDGRKKNALRGMAIIEKLVMAKGEGVTTAQLHGYQPAYVEGESIGSAVYQEFGSDGVHDGEVETNNHYPWNRRSTGLGLHIASLLTLKADGSLRRRADERRDLRRRLALALKLIRTKIPLLADHLSQRISIPLGRDRAWRYTDDETQWTFGFVWQYDGSNVIVCNQDGSRKTWKIRFGEHECI